MPDSKTRDVLELELCEELDANGGIRDFFEFLLEEMRGNLLHLTNQADRDIERIELERLSDGGLYRGYMGERVRLFCGVSLHRSDDPVAQIVLATSKGNTDAGPHLFGAEGPEVGNSLLVARLLHVGIFCLRAAGIAGVVSQPVTDRVRGIYGRMGFEDGEILDLGSPGNVRTAFYYVRSAYTEFGLALKLPPLPFRSIGESD